MALEQGEITEQIVGAAFECIQSWAMVSSKVYERAMQSS